MSARLPGSANLYRSASKAATAVAAANGPCGAFKLALAHCGIHWVCPVLLIVELCLSLLRKKLVWCPKIRWKNSSKANQKLKTTSSQCFCTVNLIWESKTPRAAQPLLLNAMLLGFLELFAVADCFPLWLSVLGPLLGGCHEKLPCTSPDPLIVFLLAWAARYYTGLLIKLTPKGVVFSFLFSLSLPC